VITYSMTRKTTPLPKKPDTKKDHVRTRFKTVIRPPRQFFRQWRKYRGNMTLEEAAGKAGMTAGNLSAMERGEQGYTPAGLQALAEVYQTSPGWLLEVNPLEEGEGLMTILGRASETEKRMIADIAKTIIGKTGTGPS
jgi:transcriptional regulator with XRE-family HTH domain